MHRTRRLHRSLAAGLLLATAAPATPALAAAATLVRDLNSNPSFSGPGDAAVSGLAVAGGKVLFSAFEPATGQALWISDGTPLGTLPLHDLATSPASGFAAMLASTGGFAYFAAHDPVSFGAYRLWRTDGTRDGTFPLSPSLQFEFPGSPATLRPVLAGQRLFFTGCSGPARCEPWTSDGTAAGTFRIADLSPEHVLHGPWDWTVVGSTAYFFATTDAGASLWRTDGTAAGTTLLRSFGGFQEARLLTRLDSRLLFVAEDDGEELWVSDGTAAGTRPLTAFAAAEPFYGTRFIKVLGGLAYFVADDVVGGSDLWRSDGTAAGTRRVTNFGFGGPFWFDFDATQVELVGGTLLFAATDGLSGYQVWTSGGTPESTAPLAGCGQSCPRVLGTTRFARVGNRVLFDAEGAQGGSELWSTDGTGARTGPLGVELCSGSCLAPPQFVVVGGAAYFFGARASDSGLWRSDGTAAGTRFLAHAGLPPFDPFARLEAVALGGTVLFAASAGFDGTQLWATDGTAAATAPLTAFQPPAPSSSPSGLLPLPAGAFFNAHDGERFRFWASDGTAAGTASLLTSDGRIHSSRRIGSLIYFVLDDFQGHSQLWRSDGTAAGTFPLTSFTDAGALDVTTFAGQALFSIRDDGGFAFWTSNGTVAGTAERMRLPGQIHELRAVTGLGSEIYFLANDSESGREQAWRSDGTLAGTRRLSDFDSSAFADHPPQFTRLGASVYFTASATAFYVPGLWRTDGTAAGTVPVLPGGQPRGRGVWDLTEFGGALYFFGPTSHGNALFRSDGTAAGTTVLAPVAPPVPFDPMPGFPTPVGGTLFFVADDGAHGTELWKTDGTAAGTLLVKDVLPGAASSGAKDLAAGGGRLYFTANDGAHGSELWESDGSAAGTRMVQDLAPGVRSSQPAELTVSGQQLFFRADDGVWGAEPWVLPLAAGQPSCLPSATALCLAGGRYRVEAHWRDFADLHGAGQAVALTADTGYFWFFDPANVEVVLKVLKAEAVNQHVWVFYGALSTVEYTLTVTDTVTGAARRYVNPRGRLASVADTHAFGPLGATPSSLSFGPQAAEAPPPRVALRRNGATGPCIASSTRLCLNGGRFAVEARWKIPGSGGAGAAVPLTADTGYFWFFGASNVEIVLKVLDGRALNGKFWVFYGALSDVEYTLTVTDTATGAVKEYKNPRGRLASVADTGAF